MIDSQNHVQIKQCTSLQPLPKPLPTLVLCALADEQGKTTSNRALQQWPGDPNFDFGCKVFSDCSSNKCIASSNKSLTSSNKKLLNLF